MTTSVRRKSVNVKRKKAPAGSHLMKPIRCAEATCGHFLGYEDVKYGFVQIKCHHCKETTLSSTFGEDVKPPEHMSEFRCSNCGRFLCSEAILEGSINLKCRGCGTWNRLDIAQEISIIEEEVEEPNRPE